MIRSVVLCLSFVLCATNVWAGADPVNPSSDVVVAVPTVSAEVSTYIVALLGPIAGTSEGSTSAIATITQSAGTPAALTAIGTLSVSIAEGIASGALTIPALDASQASQAAEIIDQVIAGLASSGTSVTALASIRDAILAAQR